MPHRALPAGGGLGIWGWGFEGGGGNTTTTALNVRSLKVAHDGQHTQPMGTARAHLTSTSKMGPQLGVHVQTDCYSQ